jgi:hypothetical protein
MEQRVSLRKFRVVGQLANFSVCQPPTRGPGFMTITVTPVTKHPVEEACEHEHGPIDGFVS